MSPFLEWKYLANGKLERIRRNGLRLSQPSDSWKCNCTRFWTDGSLEKGVQEEDISHVANDLTHPSCIKPINDQRILV
jgi:hypothetical protein